MQQFGDNFIPVIPEEEGDMLHSQEHPFCLKGIDANCPCHEDQMLIAEVATQVQDGLLTPDEATRMVEGAQI
ncbi:MAG TPA: hypothetical protein VNG51_17960 [Ktedonobacteraceae bacterium]|nr:hypothetical protein [Ktedonobacteraceae bacterium]